MAPRRSTRVILAALTALFAFVGLGAWAFSSAVGAAPDDDYHLASIWCSWGERDQLCAPGEEPSERVVSERLPGSSACFAQHSEQSAQCPLDDARMVTTERGNFVGSYPPVFYSVMGIFASPDIAVSTMLMRLFNAALFVGAATAVIVLLKPGQRGPIIFAGAVALVPLGVFIIPSVNPSSWAIMAGLLVWASLYGYFTAASRSRAIALGSIGGVLAVMGAGARGDSAVYVAFAALVAMILTFERSRKWLLRAILPIALILVGAFFFLASNQSSDIAVAGVVKESAGSGEGTTEAATAGVSGMGLIIANLRDLPWLWTGGTGTWGLGWYDTTLPNTVWVGMIGVLFALLLWGLRVMNTRKAIVLVLALGALTLLPIYVLYGKDARVGEWVQPRYILPVLVILASVALFGFAKDHIGLSRLQTAVVFAVVAVANALSLHANFRRYITGLDEQGFNLNANIEWWWNIPVSPMLVWFGGSAAFALMLVGLWLWLYPQGERPGASIDERSPELIGK